MVALSRKREMVADELPVVQAASPNRGEMIGWNTIGKAQPVGEPLTARELTAQMQAEGLLPRRRHV